MKDKYCLRKTAIALTAVGLLAFTGVFGISSVTAWATATVNTEGINVRQSAVDGEAVDTLPEGKSVTIVDTTIGSDGNTWYQITYTSNGGEELGGWVRADLLNTDAETAVEEEAEIAETAAEEAAEDAEDAAQEAVTSEEAAEAAEALAEDEEELEPVASNSEGVSYVISSSIPAEVIPDGFQKTTVSYEGKDVSALVMNSAEVYLLYMEDTSNTAPGRLVVYDLAKSELIPYISFDTDDGFILLLNIPEAELTSVSDRFALTTCDFDSGTMDALQMTQKDSVISESANLTDFYYMYGVNRDGMYGWYVYDSSEGTIQENILSMHYNLNGTSVEEEEHRSGFSLDSLSVAVIVGIVVILLLLVILVIIFGLRYRQLAKEMEQMSSRRSSRRPSSGSSSKGSSSKARKSSGGSPEPESSYMDDSSPYGSVQADSGVSGQDTQSMAAQGTQNLDFSSGTDSGSFGATTDPLQKDSPDSQVSPATQRKTRRPAKDTDFDDDDLTFL